MSDDEGYHDDKAHKRLLQGISSLGKTQHIRKVSRSEPQNVPQGEFNLVKPVSKANSSITLLNEVVQLLERSGKDLDTVKRLKKMHATHKILAPPLEKPAAQRIKRIVGYEKTKNKLARWDAVVAKNRSAEQQVFPLQGETIFIDTAKYSKPVQLSIKSDLMLEMEGVEAKLKAIRKERNGYVDDDLGLAKREDELLQQKLTREELQARRKELAYLKLRESQKSAKARQQNRIKSKKYHKLLKRQKLQERIKEFEILQKTNPEAALEKLNALEKNRVLERASLRHKNTGTWAKNLQVRAKYDRDVRQDLSEALQKSRELTQKQDLSDKDEESDDEIATTLLDVDTNHDPFNPWTKVAAAGALPDEEPNEKDANWRKYWLERNKNEKAIKAYQEKDAANELSDVSENRAVSSRVAIKANVGRKKLIANGRTKQTSSGRATHKKQQKKPMKKIMEYGWIVEELDSNDTSANQIYSKELNIDDIFDAQEDKIQASLTKKMSMLSKRAKQMNKSQLQKQSKKKLDNSELKNLEDLSFKGEQKLPQIDEELNNENLKSIVPSELESCKTTASIRSMPVGNGINTKTVNVTQRSDAIDVNKLVEVKLRQPLRGFHVMNDGLGDADIDETVEPNRDEQRQMTLSEAFEDDDIIADFSHDKSKDTELKNAEIQLAMPGWGVWSGAGIQAETADRNRRFVLNLAKRKTEEQSKRRDENKDGLYINEEASKQLRSHLVSDLPFPFTSTQEYEASIRTPLGRNFVPETAFRVLTRPDVITRKGHIIEPMDESELIKPVRRPRLVVDRRIERALKPKKAQKNRRGV